MGGSDSEEPALRIERGQASDEELAALAVVLLALRRAGPQRGRPAKGVRRWRRPEAYQAPRSWQ
jgi:hypothetical protein